MPILALGVSHRRAAADLLGRLAFGEEDLPKAYRRLADLPSVSEAVLLSTCNRVEVYAEVNGYHAGFQDLKSFLADERGVEFEEFADPLYAHYEDDAVEHLFGVAAGVDSMVVGEPQILDQVRAAARRARQERAAGGSLEDVFRRAVRFGREARDRTGIGARPAALIEVGADLAAEVLGGLEGKGALVVGAGRMGALALAVVQARGVRAAHVLNRTPARAEVLAYRHGATAGPLHQIEEALARADVVVTSTGAAEEVVSAPMVRAAMAGRPDRPLFLVDLAVPRDVDPTVASIRGVGLAGIEDLGRALGHDRGEDADVAHVRALAAEEVRALAARRRERRLAPLIQALHDRGEAIRAHELRRLGARLGSLDPREREAMEALTRGIVRKLLHDPVVRLKLLSEGGDGHARALAELFGLEPSGGRPATADPGPETDDPGRT